MSSNPPTATAPATLAAFDQSVERSQQAAALEILRGLCVSADLALDDATVRGMAERLKAADWAAAADSVVASQLESEDVQPWAGALWARLKITQSDWGAYKYLRTLLLKGPVGEQAAVGWIRALVERGEKLQLLRLASVGEHWLRQHTPAWGEMAAGLRAVNAQSEGHFWTWGWQELPELTSADLLHVSEILRANDRDHEGAAANMAALERQPHSPLAGVHSCWLAADEVVARDFTAAEARLRRIDPQTFTPENRLLHTLVTAAVSVGSADATRRPEVLSDARQSVDAACRDYPPLRHDPARVRLLRTVANQWAEHGGFTTTLWSRWRGWRL